MSRDAAGDALGRAGGSAGGTLAVITPRSAGVRPCPGEGEEPSGECLPLSSAAAEPIGMRALGRRPRTPGPGPALACGPQQLHSNGEACNPEGLAGRGGDGRGEREPY